MRCIIWPEQYAEFGQLVVADSILMVRGRGSTAGPGSEESNPDRDRADSAGRSGPAALRGGIVIRVSENRTPASPAIESLRENLARLSGQLRAATGACAWPTGNRACGSRASRCALVFDAELRGPHRWAARARATSG